MANVQHIIPVLPIGSWGNFEFERTRRFFCPSFEEGFGTVRANNGTENDMVAITIYHN
jgi:hypothetical protein